MCMLLSVKTQWHSVFIEASLNQKTKMSSIYNIICSNITTMYKSEYVYIEKGRELQKDFLKLQLSIMKSRARNFVISIDFFIVNLIFFIFLYFSGVCFYFECWPQDWFKKFGLNFWDFHVEKFVKRLWIYLAEFEY